MGAAVNNRNIEASGSHWFRAHFKWILILCISLSIITSYYHHYVYVASPNQQLLSQDHFAVMTGTAKAPTQYRVAPYLMAQSLMDTAVALGAPNNSIVLSLVYFVLRLIATTLLYIALLKFLGIWFDLKRSILGLLFLVAVNPLAEFQYYHQPGDPWNTLFFILGYILIAKRRDAWLWLVILVGVPFRETVALLIPAYIAARAGEEPARKIILNTLALCIAWAIPWGGLRLLYGIVPNYIERRLAERNLPSIFHYNIIHPEGWLVLFLYFNVLWLALIAAWKEIPRAVRRMFIIVPIFLVIHLIWGRLVEGRLYQPLLPLFLVAGLAWLGKLPKDNASVNRPTISES